MARFVLAISLFVAACASTPKEPAAPTRGHMGSGDDPPAPRVTHPEADVTCQDETPTGTALDRRKCRSDAEREQDRQLVRDQILTPNSRPGCDPASPAGCVRDPGVPGRIHP